MKRIGLLGGISHESTIEYYRRILAKYYQRFGDMYYPEVVVYSLDFQKYTDFEDRGDLDGLTEYILQGIDGLKAAGADFALMTANSPHAVFERVAAQTSVPMISIVEVTAQAAKAAGMTRLLLLGIKFTMQGSFYPDVFAHYDIDIITPTDGDQDAINQIIFDELCLGKFTEHSHQKLIDFIDGYYWGDGIEGVILGCTELPLILKAGDYAIPFFDTVELHTEAALREALKENMKMEATA